MKNAVKSREEIAIADKICAAAYCRVSTEKEEQLLSLSAQVEFFKEYSAKNDYYLTKVYADEGISGTSLKNRHAFNTMMKAAREHAFDILFVKDISRFSRNAVDFLQSIRQLKALGIQCRFVNSNLSTEDGEFTLGILALIAQEESGNLSKRVKFGKAKNAAMGKVPNIVYGYDKTPGELFTLKVNPNEAKIVEKIFSAYTKDEIGTGKIAALLNDEGIRTKRGCMWSQTAVGRILSNPLYIGTVTNGKEEVADFLTGRRSKKDKGDWLTVCRPELAIVDETTFFAAQSITESRRRAFRMTGKRLSDKHIFSGLMECECCGCSFRRIHRTFKTKDYTKWVCSGANAHGTDFCPNRTKLDEAELTDSITDKLCELITDKNGFMSDIKRELMRRFSDDDTAEAAKREFERLSRLKKKQTELFEADIITIEELKERTKKITADLEKAERRLAKLTDTNIVTAEIYNTYCTDVKSVLRLADNALLKRIIKKITVAEDGTVRVYLK